MKKPPAKLTELELFEVALRYTIDIATRPNPPTEKDFTYLVGWTRDWLAYRRVRRFKWAFVPDVKQAIDTGDARRLAREFWKMLYITSGDDSIDEELRQAARLEAFSQNRSRVKPKEFVSIWNSIAGNLTDRERARRFVDRTKDTGGRPQFITSSVERRAQRLRKQGVSLKSGNKSRKSR